MTNLPELKVNLEELIEPPGIHGPFTKEPSVSSSDFNRTQYRPAMFVNALIASDVIAMVIAVPLGYFVRYGAFFSTSLSEYSFFYMSALITLACLYLSKSYRFSSLHTLNRQLNCLLTGSSGALFFILIDGFLSASLRNYSRVWIISSAFITFTLLVCNRIVVTKVVRRAVGNKQLMESIVVVGANEQAEKMIDMLQRTSPSAINILGIFDDRIERAAPAALAARIVGSTDELIAYVRNNRVDRVVVTLPWIATDRINRILKKLRTVPVRIDLVPNDVVWQFGQINMEKIGGVPILTVANGRVDRQVGMIKRIEDIVLSLALLVMSSPFLLIIACAIKLDSKGPVLFKQRRHGFNNQIFEVYKFRSMSVSDMPVHRIAQATRDDPRITSVGRFLRRSSLDELPQLLNVLLGHMSIVGPRPHAVQHNDEYGSIISEYFARHNVRPGITGWAQVNGLRGETDTLDKMNRRVDADLFYIENWSLALDIKIVFLTAITVWFHETAY